MHALIFLGGEYAPITVPTADLIIAADHGWDNAQKNSVTPHILVGDMDSVICVPENVETVRVPTVKDETDAQLAIRIAIDRGAKHITLAGRLSGRADHTLSVIFMLESLKRGGIKCEIIDDLNRVRLIADETVSVPRDYKFFGLLSLGETSVTAKSCRYPLEGATLRRDVPYAVSNEVVGDAATVTVSGDALLLIESN